jgi:hypothetical protein
MKTKLSCIDCRQELLTERALECDFPCDASFDYISQIDRGGLTWPTELMVDMVVQTIIVFKCLVSAKCAKQFTAAQKQRSIMAQLALQRCLQVASLSGKCSVCGTALTDLAQMCIKVVCNIALNNYTKSLGVGKSQSTGLRKLTTLKNDFSFISDW